MNISAVITESAKKGFYIGAVAGLVGWLFSQLPRMLSYINLIEGSNGLIASVVSAIFFSVVVWFFLDNKKQAAENKSALYGISWVYIVAAAFITFLMLQQSDIDSFFNEILLNLVKDSSDFKNSAWPLAYAIEGGIFGGFFFGFIEAVDKLTETGSLRVKE